MKLIQVVSVYQSKRSATFMCRTKGGGSTRFMGDVACQKVSVHVFTQVTWSYLAYWHIPSLRSQKAVYTLYLDIFTERNSSLSKESNVSLRIYLRKRRHREVMGSPSVSCPPFSSLCRCLYFSRESVGSGELTGTSLLVSSPLTLLPLESLAYVLALRRSSFPSGTPKAATSLKGERETVRSTSERTHARERGQEPASPRERGSPCLPSCRSQRKSARLLSLSQLESLNCRYLTFRRHWQLPLLCNLKNTLPSKVKQSQPMGKNPSVRPGEFLERTLFAQARTMPTANHTPNTCAREHRGGQDQQGDPPRSQVAKCLKPCPGGTCFILPTCWRQTRGRAIVRVGAIRWFTPTTSLLAWQHAESALTCGIRPPRREERGNPRTRRPWCRCQPRHLTSARRLSPSELSCFRPVSGHTNDTKAEGHTIYLGSALWAKVQNVHTIANVFSTQQK